ncbi:MAG TPA: hypothetical protein VGH15_01560, partial [Caulobacteraceae bacterium]
RRVAEIGMKMLEKLEPGASPEAPAPEAAANDQRLHPAEAFARISRGVRLALTLEAKADEALRDLMAGIVRGREAERARADRNYSKIRELRQMQVARLVHDAADRECESEVEFDDLCSALDERLEDDEAYIDIEERPLRETLERICQDLTLSPDWSRWDGEGWIDDGPPLRPPYSPFATPSARPLLRGQDGERLETPAPPYRLHSRHDLE